MESITTQNAERIQWMQLFILCVTVIGIFMSLGRKDYALEQAVSGVQELQKITIDLAKTQASMLENDRGTEKLLIDIQLRLRSLEGKN
jgi:hypothetical protein